MNLGYLPQGSSDTYECALCESPTVPLKVMELQCLTLKSQNTNVEDKHFSSRSDRPLMATKSHSRRRPSLPIDPFRRESCRPKCQYEVQTVEHHPRARRLFESNGAIKILGEDPYLAADSTDVTRFAQFKSRVLRKISIQGR